MDDDDSAHPCPMCNGTGSVTGRQYNAWQDRFLGWLSVRIRAMEGAARQELDRSLKWAEREYRDTAEE